MSDFVTIDPRDPLEKQAAAWTRLEMKKLDRSVVVEFSPGLAAWLLENRSDPAKNRRVRHDRVARYASDMAAGRWLINGETVKIGANGIINDGHHRLTGCIKSGAPFKSHVVFGIAPLSMMTIDQGKARGLEDVFRINAGVGPDIAKAARIVRILEREDPRAREAGMRESTNAVDVLAWYTSNRERFDKTDWMLKPIRSGLRLHGQKPFAAHVFYAVALMAWEQAPQKISALLNEFSAGVMPPGSPMKKALIVLAKARADGDGRVHEVKVLTVLRAALRFASQGQHGNQKAMRGNWKKGSGLA